MEVPVTFPKRLAQAEQPFYPLLIGLAYQGGVAQAEFGFFALIPHHVGSKGLETLDFTRSSNPETLLGTGVSLHLRHH